MSEKFWLSADRQAELNNKAEKLYAEERAKKAREQLLELEREKLIAQTKKRLEKQLEKPSKKVRKRKKANKEFLLADRRSYMPEANDSRRVLNQTWNDKLSYSQDRLDWIMKWFRREDVNNWDIFKSNLSKLFYKDNNKKQSS